MRHVDRVARELVAADKTFQKTGIVSRGRGGVVPQVRDAARVSISVAAQAVYRAEPEVRPDLRIPATADAVWAAFESGLRVERVANRAGISPEEADRLYAEATGGASRTETFFSGKGTLRGLSAEAREEASLHGFAIAPKVPSQKAT
jgi:hypothetical protein